MSASRPLIAIATDIVEPRPGSVRAQCSLAYSAAIARAGGMPVFIPADESLIPEQLAAFDGFVLTGGDDPRTEDFGEPTHPKATPIHPRRQAYEVRLIRELLARPQVPVLGICLGMQLMALVAGGKLDQHMPDSRDDSDRHRDDASHPLIPLEGSTLAAGTVISHHRQAVTEAGAFRVSARSDDGVVEAIEHPAARFCLGVQWHPERTPDARLGPRIFEDFIGAARAYSRERTVGDEPIVVTAPAAP